MDEVAKVAEKPVSKWKQAVDRWSLPGVGLACAAIGAFEFSKLVEEGGAMAQRVSSQVGIHPAFVLTVATLHAGLVCLGSQRILTSRSTNNIFFIFPLLLAPGIGITLYERSEKRTEIYFQMTMLTVFTILSIVTLFATNGFRSLPKSESK